LLHACTGEKTGARRSLPSLSGSRLLRCGSGLQHGSGGYAQIEHFWANLRSIHVIVVSSCRVEDLGSPQAGVGVYASGQARRTFRDSCRRCTDDGRRLCHDTRYSGIDRAADVLRGFGYL